MVRVGQGETRGIGKWSPNKEEEGRACSKSGRCTHAPRCGRETEREKTTGRERGRPSACKRLKYRNVAGAQGTELEGTKNEA